MESRSGYWMSLRLAFKGYLAACFFQKREPLQSRLACNDLYTKKRLCTGGRWCSNIPALIFMRLLNGLQARLLRGSKRLQMIVYSPEAVAGAVFEVEAVHVGQDPDAPIRTLLEEAVQQLPTGQVLQKIP